MFHHNVKCHVESPTPSPIVASGAETNAIKAVEIGGGVQNDTVIRFETVDDYREYQESLPENQRDNALSSFFIEQIIVVNEQGGNMDEKIAEGVAEKIPTVIFFMLPVFAIFLKLFFRNERLYSIEHFYHSVYIHSFEFPPLSTKALSQMVLPAAIENYLGLLLFLISVYIYLSCRNVYKQGTATIVVRLLFAGIDYLFFWLFLLRKLCCRVLLPYSALTSGLLLD